MSAETPINLNLSPSIPAAPSTPRARPPHSAHGRSASNIISAEAAASSSERYDTIASAPSTPYLQTSFSPRIASPSPGRSRSRDREVDEGLSLQRLGRAIVSRVVRTARRGNLPFLVVFLSCLVIFFSALAGIGYVDPDVAPAVSGGEFIPGAPVFDPNEAGDMARKRRLEEQRELEQQWQRKKRPMDGAWMKKQRDDKAVRRVPPKPIETAAEEKYETATDTTAGILKRAMTDVA